MISGLAWRIFVLAVVVYHFFKVFWEHSIKLLPFPADVSSIFRAQESTITFELLFVDFADVQRFSLSFILLHKPIIVRISPLNRLKIIALLLQQKWLLLFFNRIILLYQGSLLFLNQLISPSSIPRVLAGPRFNGGFAIDRVIKGPDYRVHFLSGDDYRFVGWSAEYHKVFIYNILVFGPLNLVFKRN